MADDGFELWLGRIASDRPLRHRLSAGINRAGRNVRTGPSRFTGARIGRGSGVGRILSTRDRNAGLRSRRAVVKARFVKLGAKGLGQAKAHLNYLQRDGTTRGGERGTLYGAERDTVDGKDFLERQAGDRHQFRFIVSPEDGGEYEDLKPLVRRLMTQVEQDLGTGLDWVAVDHFNTGHPHAHVILRGKDDMGKDLVIAREYLTHGLRERTAELVNLDLGPRTDAEILRSRTNEMGQERFTDLDRRLIRSIDDAGIVRAVHRHGVEQSLRAGRLQTLGRLGLAREVGRAQWALDPELEATLRRMGERGDIIRTMQRAMTERLPERSLADQAIYDPAEGQAKPIIGRVVMRGLSDEHADRHYLIVDGVDGRSHYVDIGHDADPIPVNGIVHVTGRPVAVRDVDRTIAAVAAASHGHYDVDEHLRHDPQATERFANMHVRRLEAIRRATGAVTRDMDGSWTIAPDHLERVEAYERAMAQERPVIVATLSMQPLDTLPAHDGATWLDRELMAEHPADLQRGFGADVRKALAARMQWLAGQQLAEIGHDSVQFPTNMIATLQQRELRRMAMQLSQELGLHFAETRAGEWVEGKVAGHVQVGDAKFAVIEKSREFALVPWARVFDRAIGKQVSGQIREGGIDWTIGRSRGHSIGM